MKTIRDLLLQPSPRGSSKWKSCIAAVGMLMVYGAFAAVPARASFWNSSTVPGTPAAQDWNDVTVGLRFYSDVAGSVLSVRFYKGSSNNGTHTGILWSSSGAKLASVTFSNETSSGWQQANFAQPVSITANTTYVISYEAPQGNYADDANYNWGSLNAAPLHISGSSPGVYGYGNGPAFPNQVWSGSNYYVDLVFAPAGGGGGTTKYSISGKVSGTSGATVSLSGAASASVKTDSSGNYSFAGLANGSYLLSPSQSGYSFTPATLNVNVNNANVSGQNFTASVSVAHNVSLSWTASGSSGVAGYRVYRAGVSGGPYTLVSSSLVTTTSYVDSNVSAGDTYYYVTTAVNSSGVESSYSNQTVAVVP